MFKVNALFSPVMTVVMTVMMTAEEALIWGALLEEVMAAETIILMDVAVVFSCDKCNDIK